MFNAFERQVAWGYLRAPSAVAVARWRAEQSYKMRRAQGGKYAV